jgi:hypothetical protein
MAKEKHQSKSTERRLTARQLAVIADMFIGELAEQEVLDKHKVSRQLYNKWLADDLFAEQFDKQIAASYRQSAAIIARYAPLAAAKLVELTASEKVETARKACLDIISMNSHDQSPAPVSSFEDRNGGDKQPQISAETAGKILAVLAEEKQS